MAITRAQIAKQLLAKGGRIGLFKGAEADARAGKGDISPGTDRGGNVRGGNGGNNYTDRIIDVAERKRRQDLRDITNRIRDDKIEEDLEKFRGLGSNQRKFQNLLTKISPVAMFASKFGPLNTRDFFTENYLSSKNAPMTKEQFANLTNEEQEAEFDKYMDARMSGETDAYGNTINRGGNGINQILPVDTTFAQAPSNMDQESETKEEDEGLNLRFRKDGGRINAMDGGIMNTDIIGGAADGNIDEMGRQMYFVGKLVKKATRAVKKIVKSPLGKAALLYTGLGGLGSIAGGGTFFGNFMSPMNQLRGVGSIFSKGGLENIMSKAKLGKFVADGADGISFQKNVLGKALTSPLGIIAGTSLAAGLLTAEQEEEAQLIADETGIDIAEIRANPNKYLGRRFRAEGGSMDEPVAKKTMPLLDMGGKEMDLRAEGGFVPIGRMEKADDVPARLSKNEFVFTAEAVRNAGEGDVDKGAEVMYNMMKNLESGGDVSEESQGLDGARKMFQTSQRLEEVL
jgi:hypothetical protein